MVLPIFPPHALDSSVITTVWIGLCVVAALNLRFGTTMAGLVVPGYLVPMLMAKPVAAAVIVVEAIATYALVRLFADLLMRRAGATELFGRDRYFAILLMSILVRIAGDLWILPAFGAWLYGHGVKFEWRSELYSFGLVIVALSANQYWNGGLRRGLASFALYVGLTFLIVRWLLVPFTNFDVSSLNFVYEDLASNILASPKAYMIMLTTAFFASRMNLSYGWDFSGIMVPALVALVWYEPLRMAGTAIETVVVYALGRAALALPQFRRINMEGARLLLLFATVAYAYKIGLGFLLDRVAPQYKPSDFFAFGYLISTLLAVKMHSRNLTWQLASTTLTASLVGVVSANLLGYALTLLAPAAGTPLPLSPVAAATGGTHPSLALRMAELKRDLYRIRADRPEDEDPVDARALVDGLRLLARYRDDRTPTTLAEATARLTRDRYALERAGSWYVVSDLDTQRNSGLYAVNMAARTGIAVSVPAPLDEPGALEAAAQLADDGGHALLAVAGARMPHAADAALSTLNRRTPFAQAHALARDGVLMVRGTDEERRGVAADLWIQGGLPEQLDLAGLRSALGAIGMHWGSRIGGNAFRGDLDVPLLELSLTGSTRLHLMARTEQQAVFVQVADARRVDAYLADLLVRDRNAIAEAGSNRPTLPTMGDLLYFQQEVVAPLLDVAERWESRPDEDALRAIAASASTLGYRLTLYRQQETAQAYAILAEPSGQGRFWGTYVFRLGHAVDDAVEVPRPLEEMQSFGFGAALYAKVQARTLLVAGAHSAARSDGAADVLAPENRNTLFNAVHQALLLRRKNRVFLQIRGQGATAGATTDVIAAFAGRPPNPFEKLDFARRVAMIDDTRARVSFAGTAPDNGRYRAGIDQQAVATARLPGHRFVTLWVPLPLRDLYRLPPAFDREARLFQGLGIRIDPPAPGGETTMANANTLAPDADARDLVDQFVATRNIRYLLDLRQRGWAMRRIVDPVGAGSVLELRNDSRGMAAIRNLEPLASGSTNAPAGAPVAQEAVRAFVASRRAWLLPTTDRK